MKSWLVGSISVACCALALPAGAQAPQAPASGSFPAVPAPAPAAPPAASPTTGPTGGPTGVTQAPSPAAEALPPPPPAAAPPPAAQPTTPQAPAVAPVAPTATPTDPPPLDTRSNRERRPFFIGGELGWNGLAGLGVNFSYHPDPHFAVDTGAGLSLTGWRASFRLRGNLLTSEWTPFVGVGLSYATGLGNQDVELEAQGEKAKLRVLSSPFFQVGAGLNYTGKEGFVFTATTGYSKLLRDHNTTYGSGSRSTYEDAKSIYGGGLILSVAFGYAF